MGKLADTIERRIRNASSLCISGIDSPDELVCVVRLDDMKITFNVDPRDHSISSSLLFCNEPEQYRCDLQAHVVAKAFAGVEWRGVSPEASLQAKTETEVDNITRLIEALRGTDLTGRDLLHFARGYDAAYTDYYVSKVVIPFLYPSSE